MNARRICSAVILTTGIWCTPQRLHGQSADAHASAAFSAVEVVREHRYQVDVRMRPFLVSICESNIGDGRLTWRRGRDGTLGYEFSSAPILRGRRDTSTGGVTCVKSRATVARSCSA